MPTKLELEEVNRHLKDEIVKLSIEIDLLRATNEKLESHSNSIPMAGWLITCPNVRYQGITAGYQFRNGQAFIADVEGAEKKMKFMVSDFGYEAEYVEDWTKVIMDDDRGLKGSLIDMLATQTVL